MIETLCLRNEDKRYIVSIGRKILIVTHDERMAKKLEKEIVSLKITDEQYSVIPGRKK